MRKPARGDGAIRALLPRVRWEVLAAAFMQPDRWWYLSDLAKHLKRRPSSLQRELSALAAAGILRARREGNRAYFQADRDCPFFNELRGLMAKTAGLVDVLREVLRPLSDRISLAFVYGSVARAEERSTSDIDLVVVGDVGLSDVAPLLTRGEARLGRPVNATVYRPVEFVAKGRRGHHFLRRVLGQERLFVVGDQRALAGLVGEQPG